MHKQFITKDAIGRYNTADSAALAAYLVRHGWTNTQSSLILGNSSITIHSDGTTTAQGAGALAALDALVSACDVPAGATEALRRAYSRIAMYRASLEMAGAR